MDLVSQAPAPRPKRLRFVPSGTPFQVEQRTRLLAKHLRRDAARLRRDAARMERVAAKIEENQAAGHIITANLIGKAANEGVGLYAAYQLVGLPVYGGRDAIIDRLYGPPPHVVAAADVPSPAPQPRLASSFIEPVGEPPAPEEATIAKADAVAQATAIARSASGTEVDWSREPLNERERKIRARWLEENLKTSIGCSIITLTEITHWCRGHAACDLTAAAKRAKSLSEATDQVERQRVFQDIADELDRERENGEDGGDV